MKRIIAGIWVWGILVLISGQGAWAGEAVLPVNTVTLRGEMLLTDALEQIAAAGKRVLVLGQGVEDGRVQADIRELPLRQAAERLLYLKGYGVRITDKELVVLAEETKMFRVPLPPVTQGLESVTSNESVSGANGSLENAAERSSRKVRVGTKVLVRNNADRLSFWEDVEQNVRALLSPRGKAAFNRTAGILLVTDTPTVMLLLERLMAELEERVSRQILVDVRVIEVTLGRGARAGIDWTALMDRGDIRSLRLTTGLVPGAADASGFILSAGADVAGGAQGVAAVLKALEEYGRVEVMSRPRVAMLNNTVANIQVGATRTYVESSNIETTQSGGTIVSGTLGEVHGGVTLQIIGNMVGDDIYLNVTPVVSSVDAIRAISLGGGGRLEAPETSMKSMNTVVRLASGSTAVIGGLITRRKGLERRAVPLLGGLPLLGRLFSYESREQSRVELVIMITPRKG